MKCLIFIAFILLLFILMSVRSYDPAYTDPPASLKSLMQLNRAPGMKLTDIKVSPTDGPPARTPGDNGAVSVENPE